MTNITVNFFACIATFINDYIPGFSQSALRNTFLDKKTFCNAINSYICESNLQATQVLHANYLLDSIVHKTK